MGRRVVRPTPSRQVVIHPGLEPIGTSTTLAVAGVMGLNLTGHTGSIYRTMDYRARATGQFGPLQNFGPIIAPPQATSGRRTTPATALPATAQPSTTRNPIVAQLAAAEGLW